MKHRWIIVLVLWAIPGLRLRAAEYSCFDRIPRPQHHIYFKTMPAIALDDAGRVFAVDGRDHALYVLSAHSDEAAKIAGQGQGPGELQHPFMIQTGLNGVLIADQTGINIFSGEGKFINRFRVDGQVISLAAEGDTIFAARTGGDGLIQPFDLSGKAGKAFGSGYDFPRSLYKDWPDGFVESIINEGKFLVGEKALYFVSFLFDEIQAFDRDGHLLKKASFGGEEAEKNRTFFFKTGQKSDKRTFKTNPLIIDAGCRSGVIYLLHRGGKGPETSEIWEISESDWDQVRKTPLRDAGSDVGFWNCRSMAVGGNPGLPVIYVSLHDEKSSEALICLFREEK